MPDWWRCSKDSAAARFGKRTRRLLDEVAGANAGKPPEDRPLAREVAERLRVAAGGSDLAQMRRVDPALLLALTVDSPEPVVQGVIPTLASGDRLGRFRILEKLGEGGMGAVFRAEDLADGTLVAIKVLHAEPRPVRSGPAALPQGRALAGGARFAPRHAPGRSELRRRCLFPGPGIRCGPQPGRAAARRGQLDEPAALDLIADAARGLAAAHALGIVHRDVKPDNLLLTVSSEDAAGPRLKVTDFGLARHVDQSESLALTQAGTMVGTPLYMAPEQFDGRPVDARADVYALGATLFHLLAGRPPFRGDSFQDLIAQARRVSRPPSWTALRRPLARPWPGWWRSALAKEPDRRPANAGVFLRLLEDIRSGDAASLQAHPLAPTSAGRTLEYVYTWELDAAPQQLWPHVSNTERLNRAAGLPAIRYAFRPDSARGTRRFASARVGGLRMEWEEHPFEWVEGRRMGVLREFRAAPSSGS